MENRWPNQDPQNDQNPLSGLVNCTTNATNLLIIATIDSHSFACATHILTIFCVYLLFVHRRDSRIKIGSRTDIL